MSTSLTMRQHARAFAVRVVFVVALVRLAPFPIGYLPGTDWADHLLSKLFKPATKACVWLGARLTGYHGLLLPGNEDGSGDRLWDWTLLLGLSLVAPVVALVWSAVARHRPPSRRLENALRVYIRYWLAAQMLIYGANKLELDQMPYPALPVLEQSLGAQERMSLLWSFMGLVPAYERFAGAMEFGAGLLLLWRRTSLLGALATAGVMLNVFALNLGYDVTVKMLSCMLLLTALGLAAYDLPWLVPVLLQRTPPPRPSPPPSRRRWLLVVAELLFAAALVKGCWDGWPRANDVASGWPLHGRWLVLRQVRDGHELPPLTTEPRRWRIVYLDTYPDGRRYLNADRNDEERERRWLSVDEGKHAMTFLAKPELGLPALDLTMTQPDAQHLTLRDAKGDFVLELVRQPRPYLLQTRGFHWVSEDPLLR